MLKIYKKCEELYDLIIINWKVIKEKRHILSRDDCVKIASEDLNSFEDLVKNSKELLYDVLVLGECKLVFYDERFIRVIATDNNFGFLAIIDTLSYTINIFQIEDNGHWHISKSSNLDVRNKLLSIVSNLSFNNQDKILRKIQETPLSLYMLW